MAAYGFAGSQDANGNSPLASIQEGDVNGGLVNAASRINGVALSPITGGNSNGYFNAPNEVFWGGVGLAIGGWAVGKVFPSLRRAGLKIGKKHKITLV